MSLYNLLADTAKTKTHPSNPFLEIYVDGESVMILKTHVAFQQMILSVTDHKKAKCYTV